MCIGTKAPQIAVRFRKSPFKSISTNRKRLSCVRIHARALKQPDFSFQRCYPDSWAYERLPDLFRRLFPDAFLGPKLWSVFQKLGYSPSNVLVDSVVEMNQNDLRRLYRLSVEAME